MRDTLFQVLAIVVAIFFSAATPLRAQEPNLRNVIDLVLAGKYDEARAMHDRLPHAPIDEVFLEAQIFTAQGRLADAITTYRAILIARPDLFNARNLLADLLFQVGDWDGARFQYRLLRDATTNTELKIRYSNILAEIQRRIPSGYTTSFTLTPSTNINRGSSGSTDGGAFSLSGNSLEKSGIGAQLGASAFLRIPKGDRNILVFTAQAFFNAYSDDDFNVLQGRGTVQYEINEAETFRTFGANVGRVVRRNGSNYTSFGLTHTGRKAIKGPNTLTWATDLRYLGFDTSPGQDGFELGQSIGLQRQMNPTTSLIGGVRATRGRTEVEHFRYAGASVNLGLSKNWRGGWSTFAVIEAGFRQYEGIFPIYAVARRDDFWSLRGVVLNSAIDIGGFAPRVDCLYTRNKSNTDPYDYDATECGLQLTKEF